MALEDALSSEVEWPNRMERERISNAFALKGFPGCVGLIDGTLLKLSQQPKKDGETYFDCKRNYSLNAQVVCDNKKNHIFFSGMPGACADSTCLRRSSLYEKLKIDTHISSQFFDAGQYLIADSGYVPLPHLVCAYRNAAGSPEREDVEVESRNFNLTVKIRSVGCGVLLETLCKVEKLKELTAALNRTSENTEKQIAKIR
ncbi:hypothetical protein R1flu_026032 [Riccia fluitans]|uniref:DDE Tnp4 domain-containing protein n=1 Tax=Riccia fluitans TaxID=41844 RepID=A0ABD1XET2_9MARC